MVTFTSVANVTYSVDVVDFCLAVAADCDFEYVDDRDLTVCSVYAEG